MTEKKETVKDALAETSALLEGLYNYAKSMRRQVITDPERAAKGGFKFVDLDSLDDVMLRLRANRLMLKIGEKTW